MVAQKQKKIVGRNFWWFECLLTQNATYHDS